MRVCSVIDSTAIHQIRRGLTEFRSAYYQDENWAEQCGPGFNFEPTDVCDPDERKVAIFSISGWTDDLFPPIESFRMFKYLKRLDPRWPVAVGTADVGHPRAQNKPEVWQRMNNQAWQFLEANINGSHDQETTVYSEPTICPGEPAFTSAQQLTATTPEGLSQGTLVMGAIRSGSTNSPGSGGFDLAGPRTDPVLGTPGCASSPHEPPQTAGKYVAYSQPLKSSSIYVGLGHVTLPNAVVSGHTATLNVRVFVEKPPGQQDLLVTRGTYRYFIPPEDAVPAPARDIKIPLFGNHRDLDPGDVLRLDVTQVDHPFLRPSNEPTETTFGAPRLTLTTREAGFTFVLGT